MPRRLTIFLLLLMPASIAAWAALAPDPLVPPSTGGLAAVDDALKRLSTHRRVLVIGAHPDDEDSSLLSLVAGMGGEAAYFSLSRGEGGQNLIGPELGVGLGLIRTEELLGARRIEGNRQYFSRAYDFGYTRSLEETLERWPLAVLLEDAARVVRDFKPQVIVSIFRDGGGGTHGQHQAAGVVAHRIYELAGDPSFHPEQAAAGLPPWTPQALYRRAWWRGEEAPTIEVRLDGVNPITGRGWGQIAAASRSMHRSQDMGRMQIPGGASTAVVWVAGGAGSEGRGLFAGIDTSLAAIADLLPPSPHKDEVRSLLENVGRKAALARGDLSPVALSGALPGLISVRDGLMRVRGLVATGNGTGTAADALIAEKLAVVERAILAAAGVAVDARADRERVVPGEELKVTLSVWNSGTHEVSVVAAELVGLDGWGGGSLLEQPALLPVEGAEREEWTRAIALEPTAPATLPYFLTQQREGDLYHWSGAEGESLTRAFGPSQLAVELTLEVNGTQVRTSREVVHAFADQASGEVRRPLQIVPALEVTASPSLVLRPRSENGPSRIEVRLRSNADAPLAGAVAVEVPEDWPRAEAVPFAIADAGGGAAAEVSVEVPAGAPPGRYRLPVVALLDSGERAGGAFPTTEYEHVRPRPRPEPSVVELEVLDLELPAVERIAWVRGASDSVSDALTELGLAIDVLDARGVAEADLAGYEVVVIGSRAYETDAALGRVNEKLLDFARAGGALIVNYQQYQFSRGGFAPFAFEIHRPHDRITDEAAPVRLLVPEYPVFNHPNYLSSADWEGWVQERGLYFGGTWGEEFTPLLGIKDPDEEEKLGGLLVAPLGEGTYVYTGLSFFREIPAGVPGAYRLLANLLALGEK
jgi:LmbE family N-acetylglucosaminyl deacetylase